MTTRSTFFEPSLILQDLQEKLNDEPIYFEIQNKIDFNNKKGFITSLVDHTALNQKDYLHKLLVNELSQKNIKKNQERAYSIATESIILMHGRPVLSIIDDMFEEPESAEWKSRLGNIRKRFTSISKAVGRIELINHPSYQWVGTGWIYGDNFMITNRHVANEFVYKKQDGRFSFKSYENIVCSYIDLKEEYSNTSSNVFSISEIIYVSKEYEEDIAIFKVRRENEEGEILPSGNLELYNDIYDYNHEDNYVGVIGYPAYDSRIPDSNVMAQLFKNIYNKKRFSPGKIKDIKGKQYLHDSSTLPGNSGSPVIDITTGKVVGLHFGGNYKETNYAIGFNHLREIFQHVGI